MKETRLRPPPASGWSVFGSDRAVWAGGSVPGLAWTPLSEMQKRCKELSLWVRDEGEVESLREEGDVLDERYFNKIIIKRRIKNFIYIK